MAQRNENVVEFKKWKGVQIYVGEDTGKFYVNINGREYYRTRLSDIYPLIHRGDGSVVKVISCPYRTAFEIVELVGLAPMLDRTCYDAKVYTTATGREYSVGLYLLEEDPDNEGTYPHVLALQAIVDDVKAEHRRYEAATCEIAKRHHVLTGTMVPLTPELFRSLLELEETKKEAAK